MVPYILSGFFSIMGGFLGLRVQNKKIAITLAFIPLFVLAAFRVNIGTDYQNYVSIFYGLKYNNALMYGWIRPDPLFELLNDIIAFLGLSPQWVFIVTSAAYCYILVYAIFKLSPLPLMSIFLTFGTTVYFASFNEVNQHLACSILMISFIFAYQKRMIPFLISVCIAGLFHTMCYLFVLVYIFNYINFSPRRACILIGGVVIMFPAFVGILNKLIQLTPYAVYLTKEEYLGKKSLVGLLIMMAIMLLASLFYNSDKLFKLLYSINLLCMIITLLQGYIPLAYRIRWVFFYPIIIFIPFILMNIKDKRVAFIMKIIIIILYTFYMYVQIVVNRGHGVYPYSGLLG